MRREAVTTGATLTHHTEPSRSGLLVPHLADQLKCRVRYLVSDCSKLLRRPGPLQTGPSIEKPLLRAGSKQGPSATRESGSRPWPSSLARQNGVGKALRPFKSPARPVPRHLRMAICCLLGQCHRKQAVWWCLGARAVFLQSHGKEKKKIAHSTPPCGARCLTKATDGTHATRFSSASHCGS